MIIVFNKLTGKIIGSFPEIYSVPEWFKVTSEDGKLEDFDKLVLSPEEAYDFENPFNPKNIHDYTVDTKTNKLLDKTSLR